MARATARPKKRTSVVKCSRRVQQARAKKPTNPEDIPTTALEKKLLKRKIQAERALNLATKQKDWLLGVIEKVSKNEREKITAKWESTKKREQQLSERIKSEVEARERTFREFDSARREQVEKAMKFKDKWRFLDKISHEAMISSFELKGMQMYFSQSRCSELVEQYAATTSKYKERTKKLLEEQSTGVRDKQMEKWWKCCDKCGAEYTSTGDGTPRILRCGHTICEGCTKFDRYMRMAPKSSKTGGGSTLPMKKSLAQRLREDIKKIREATRTTVEEKEEAAKELKEQKKKFEEINEQMDINAQDVINDLERSLYNVKTSHKECFRELENVKRTVHEQDDVLNANVRILRGFRNHVEYTEKKFNESYVCPIYKRNEKEAKKAKTELLAARDEMIKVSKEVFNRTPDGWKICGCCRDFFNSAERLPLILKCGHTMCKSCVEETIKARHGGAVRCPFDRRKLKLTAADVGRIKENRAISLN
ncbi:unnamed protein product [Caenorhabditis sp. 36 PRJEB53466]|nr:unnamed protein product [Caenorhabditis sp. 36 PRJEB53466]